MHRDHTFKLIDDMIQEEAEQLDELLPRARAKETEYKLYLEKAEQFLNVCFHSYSPKVVLPH